MRRVEKEEERNITLFSWKNKNKDHRMPTSSPLPLCVAKASRNHFNEDITPLLPTGIGE
jgi:hypothetical protein